MEQSIEDVPDFHVHVLSTQCEREGDLLLFCMYAVWARVRRPSGDWRHRTESPGQSQEDRSLRINCMFVYSVNSP